MPLLILFLGAALRFHGLARDTRFHPDEALYNTFARDAVIKGDWLLSRPLDKPPLLIYANALMMNFVGVHINDAGVLDFPSVQIGEFAGRLPNTLVSILLIALIYAVGRDLYHNRRIAHFAMLLVAFSPFAIAFSSTAFTDVLLTFWMVMALWMVIRNRWGIAGLCLAFGLASKQPAPLYLPLLLAVGWQRKTLTSRRLLRFTITFALGVIVLLAWDSLRDQPSIWQVSSGRENYPNQFVPFEALIPRLTIWLGYAQTLIGPGWLTAPLGLLIVLATLIRIWQHHRDYAAQTDVILLGYVMGYGLLHWLVTFNTFDRYLLPILPLMALLVARGLIGLSEIVQRTRRASSQPDFTVATANSLNRVVGTAHGLSASISLPSGKNQWIRNVFLLAIMAVLWIPALDASEGRINVGGDLGEHDGIQLLTDYLNSKPVATVIYDHWLGWELDYYLGPWSDKRRVYYPEPTALVKDALALDEIGPRYFPVPVKAPVQPWLAALDTAGFNPTPVYSVGRFVVYKLTPPGAAKDVSDAE